MSRTGQPQKNVPKHQMNEFKYTVETCRKKIAEFVSQENISKPLNFLIDSFPQNACFLIIGGALRNFIIRLMYGDSAVTHDIDIVIGSLEKNFSMEKVFAEENVKNTDFGGLRWYPIGSVFSFDLSLLDNFLPIKKFHLEPEIDNLLATIDFDVNTLIFEVKKNKLYEQGAITAIKEKTIGFNAKKTYDKRLLAYRLLLIRHKIGFYPSREAFRFLRTAVDLDMILWVKKTLESRVSKEQLNLILADYDRICLYKNYDDYKKQEKLPEYLKNINFADQEMDSHG